jgi:hypothetical protein
LGKIFVFNIAWLCTIVFPIAKSALRKRLTTVKNIVINVFLSQFPSESRDLLQLVTQESRAAFLHKSRQASEEYEVHMLLIKIKTAIIAKVRIIA